VKEAHFSLLQKMAVAPRRDIALVLQFEDGRFVFIRGVLFGIHEPEEVPGWRC
jgi:hypothetical protein